MKSTQRFSIWSLGLVLMIAAAGRSETVIPSEGWQESTHPYASADAEPGGEMSMYAGPYPRSLNYYLDSSSHSAEILNLLYDSLLTMNPASLEFEPGIAQRVVVGDDKMTFTIHLDPEAVWSDGRPITAEDIVWTWKAILDPRHLTGPHKVDLERFQEPEVLDERTVRLVAREPHWKNLLVIAGFNPLPKHAFSTSDFNKLNFEFPVVSGPYRLAELREGFFSRFERREDWWQRHRLRNQHVGNFQTLRYMYFQERENAFDAFLKGTIDVFPVYTAHVWVNQTSGERFERNWIVKQRIHNHQPVGFQGFAMNMRRFPFDDVRVRRALAMLLNRQHMNEVLMHNQYFLHRSYYEDLYTPEHPCTNPLIPFDKAGARSLLAEAGWVADPQTGILHKDGKPFRFTFLTRDAAVDRFLVIYKEDLKDVGIEMNIVQKDWSAWMKDMDEFNYDMTWAAWAGGIWRDPEHQWSSREADRPGGQNITGFKNERVDELIARQRTEFDLEKRNAILREIDSILTAEVPYILLWNLNYTRLLYWNKFGTPPTVLGKYGDESAAASLWWYDPDAAADLQDAMARGLSLPPKPSVIDFNAISR